jgi:hypothetical protein
MADVNETVISRPIYQGTELKFSLDIEIEGFSMFDDDFKVAIKNTKTLVEIPKEEMILTDDDKFLFTIDTKEIGTGDYYIFVTAYVPDDDFDDGFRTEVQKQLLCIVTS